MVRLESLVLQWIPMTSYHDRTAASKLNLSAVHPRAQYISNINILAEIQLNTLLPSQLSCTLLLRLQAGICIGLCISVRAFISTFMLCSPNLQAKSVDLIFNSLGVAHIQICNIV